MCRSWMFYLLSCTALFASPGCSDTRTTASDTFTYGTESDSALYYYHKGWEEIMDNGRWTLSEKAFRKATVFDPYFPIGKSLVGRISQDISERERILAELESASSTDPDIELLLEVFKMNIEAMNLRETDPEAASGLTQKRWAIAENNFGEFVRKHPEEVYILAEYIEILRARHGAQSALDSLLTLTSPIQKQLPFFQGYAATLRAELGQKSAALAAAWSFAESADPSYPAPFYLLGSILYGMDSLRMAKPQLQKAIALDSNHLMARSMLAKINAELIAE